MLRPEHLVPGPSALALMVTPESAEVPPVLHHQGRLAVGKGLFAAQVPDGSVTATRRAPGTLEVLANQIIAITGPGLSRSMTVAGAGWVAGSTPAALPRPNPQPAWQFYRKP